MIAALASRQMKVSQCVEKKKVDESSIVRILTDGDDDDGRRVKIQSKSKIRKIKTKTVIAAQSLVHLSVWQMLPDLVPPFKGRQAKEVDGKKGPNEANSNHSFLFVNVIAQKVREGDNDR